MIAAQREREPRERSADGEERDDRERVAPHTRRTSRWPKSPDGLSRRTARRTANANGVCSSEVIGWTYWTTRLSETPMARPPTTAPLGSRGRRARLRRRRRRESAASASARGRTARARAMRPATAPSTAARPQPIASIQSTRTPTSADFRRPQRGRAHRQAELGEAEQCPDEKHRDEDDGEHARSTAARWRRRRGGRPSSRTATACT